MNSEQRTAAFDSLYNQWVEDSKTFNEDGSISYPAMVGMMAGFFQMAFQDLPVDSINRILKANGLKKLEENKDMQETLYKPQFDRKRHGSLHDRGGADSYYGRGRSPHWYPEGSYNGKRVTDLTPDEIAEYNAGYDANEEAQNFKEW